MANELYRKPGDADADMYAALNGGANRAGANAPAMPSAPSAQPQQIAAQPAPPSYAPPAPAPAQQAAPAPSQPAPSPAASTLPAGATDLGNNLVRLANGATVDRNHPLFQQAMGGAPAAPASPASPAAQAAPAGAVQPPTPSAPKPGPDWVPTQDGQGWVPPNHPMAWKAPIAAAPAAPVGPPPETAESVFRKTLIDTMKADPTKTGINDPAIHGQVDAFTAARQNARRQEQEATAERLASQGLLDSGAMDTAVTQSYEDMGHDIGSYSAGLVGQEVQAKRDMLKQALTLAGDRLNNEEKNALEQQLAQLDAQIKREGIGSQERLGQGDLALRGRLGDQQTSLGLLQALMGNQQFNNDLGFRIGNAEAGYNRDALLSLMKGL